MTSLRYCVHCQREHQLDQYLPMTDFTACSLCGETYRCYPVPAAFRGTAEWQIRRAGLELPAERTN